MGVGLVLLPRFLRQTLATQGRSWGMEFWGVVKHMGGLRCM